MKLNDYQEQAMRSAVYPGQGGNQGFTYNALQVAAEGGEFAGKVAKLMLDPGSITHEALLLELGDILWHTAALATELGVSLEDVAEMNLDKLARRLEEGTLRGQGDSR